MTAIVAVYVDDQIPITKAAEEMLRVKEYLPGPFKMKDMGKLHYCLGISIEHDEDHQCLRLHQKQYILKMILNEGKVMSAPCQAEEEWCQ